MPRKVRSMNSLYQSSARRESLRACEPRDIRARFAWIPSRGWAEEGDGERLPKAWYRTFLTLVFRPGDFDTITSFSLLDAKGLGLF